MSGGSYEYAYYKVEEFADSLRQTSFLRKAFREHLYKVAQAMHDIEWVDSGDMGPGDEDEAIRACLSPEVELESAIRVARETLVTLQNAIKRQEDKS